MLRRSGALIHAHRLLTPQPLPGLIQQIRNTLTPILPKRLICQPPGSIHLLQGIQRGLHSFQISRQPPVHIPLIQPAKRIQRTYPLHRLIILSPANQCLLLHHLLSRILRRFQLIRIQL